MPLNPAPIQQALNQGGFPDTIWARWFQGLTSYINNGRVTSYTVAQLPSTADAGSIVYVSNESGGATLAFYDGMNWRRVQDRAIVS